MSATNNTNRHFPSLAVSVEVLSVSYRGGNIGLSDVSFELSKPTICGLIGMNGAGKSTLFRAIMGFVSPAQGKVEICHHPVRWAQKKNIIAYVPQTEEVDWTFPVSVHDVVMMGRQGRMGILRIPSEEDKEIVLDSLKRVGMGAFADRQIGELSGGQRKRVFLARALAQQSQIMLLDEPFTGVDVKTEHAIIDILRELREEGHIIIVSTHNLASVPGYCDEVMMINVTMIASGPVSEVYTTDNLGKTFGGAINQLPVGLTSPITHDGRPSGREEASSC
ncbi:metal ABC transporter ATP-binding protein [Pantoea agglomerans]|uniref:Metal ABC transporter ATP-binding protein n=1 Tax=Enterobacter agglomerans TaxID=549 RepID=A0ACC5PWG0_ENTAG|nr:metal ABC transporter ATP-binding protein [Pantoea agglomerans]MBD8129088.1 metal ABC transporter ATP-binding protein [Pantoea agglomerans]MBD8156412.1 metal ABC transporter ATP-binding protein [Pantoea agglomerans]MBD8161177.1 metal ABC transporter ATP-binding protein [Pantoea agglomerans]MBD8234804.1 metal ABC transporter ATP-binding protein [Pantoea agglomerans]MBD8245208.1 metal ABC transporter ATP-binding protein [Pantoea agglomerans]